MENNLRISTIKLHILAIIISLAPLNAWSNESSYSKLDFDKHCKFEKPANDENAGPGSSAICQIGDAPAVYFVEGDLRQSVGFGAPKQYRSFGQFNRINNTIEWRSKNKKPYAAIVRFFIENMNLDTGSFDKAHLGQVLVVHRVAEHQGAKTCIVGLVDARANTDANVLARQVADDLAISFQCNIDRPQYHGNRGKFAGDLMF
jgi:hypothetical protein